MQGPMGGHPNPSHMSVPNQVVPGGSNLMSGPNQMVPCGPLLMGPGGSNPMGPGGSIDYFY